MDVKQEIVDAAAIVAESIVNKTTPRIYFGVVTNIDGRKCDVVINGTVFTVDYYSETPPAVNSKHPVLAPNNNMGLAFII